MHPNHRPYSGRKSNTSLTLGYIWLALQSVQSVWTGERRCSLVRYIITAMRSETVVVSSMVPFLQLQYSKGVGISGLSVIDTRGSTHWSFKLLTRQMDSYFTGLDPLKVEAMIGLCTYRVNQMKNFFIWFTLYVSSLLMFSTLGSWTTETSIHCAFAFKAMAVTTDVGLWRFLSK